MNKYNLEIPRKRNRSLIIVEGEHEKNKFFQLIFQTFPEININVEDILIYGTNIYILYNDIVREYGERWFEEDVDLPFIVGKKKRYSETLDLNKFKNVYLVFDYERQDPNFSERKIVQMQSYFSDSTEMGKLYLNYPMLESYQHFSCLPDPNYENLTVEAILQSGSLYKEKVQSSFIKELVCLPHKIEKLLFNCYGIEDDEACKQYTKSLLDIFSCKNISEQINQIFTDSLSPSELKRARYHFCNRLKNMEHIKSNMDYYKYMRNVFRQIVLHNISKASKIQDSNTYDSDLKTIFDLLDLNKILKKQNRVSADEASGFIWVLNTCVFLIPDYNIKLIEWYIHIKS